MEKHIIDLLDNNVRVVLPDLGAFIVKQRKPLKIIFNEFLKYNDGLLIEYTAKTENISKEDATKKISDFVNKVKDKLNSNENVVVSGLGVISKDASGNIAFELNENANVKQTEPSSGSGTKETKGKAKEEKKTEVAAETKKEEKKTVSTPVPPPPPPKATTPPPPPPPPKEKPVQEPAKKAVSPPVGSSYSGRYVKSDEESKNRTWLWVSVVVLTIVIVALTYYITNPKNKKPAGEGSAKPNEELMTEETKPDIVNEEDVNEEVFTQEPIIDEPVKTGKKYYIIAGCFKVPGNADKYVTTLQNKGYPALKLGYFNGYDVVAFNSFTSRSDALMELESIRNEYEPEAWIKKY